MTNSSTNNLMDEGYFAETLVFVMRITSCFLCISLLVCVLFYVKILCTKTFCHPNLRFLLIIQPILHWTFLLIIIIRHILLIFHIPVSKSLEDWFDLLSDGFLIQAVMIMLPISIERLIATLFPEKYEHMHQEIPILGVILFAIIALVAFSIVTLRETDIISDEISYLIVLILFCVAAVFFLILPFTTRRLFRKTAATRNCTISERYQTAENVRSARLLKYLSAYKTLSNIFSYVFYYLAFESEPEYYDFATELYYYWIMIQIFCQMLLTTWAHEVLRTELRKLLRIPSSAVVVEKPELRSIVGQKMVFTADEEREKYFEMYTNSWGVAPRP